jgi:WD40 repeat protein
VEYLCTMVRHTQAVNVVRWAPRGMQRVRASSDFVLTPLTGDVLASAGDDGNVITWVLDTKNGKPTFGEDGVEDKEAWRAKHMCRSSGAEIYDLAWSPDGVYFITGSMDNIARIYNAQSGMSITSDGMEGTDTARTINTPGCGASALCTRRGLGSSQRVHRNPILRPISSYLYLEDEGGHICVR